MASQISKDKSQMQMLNSIIEGDFTPIFQSLRSSTFKDMISKDLDDIQAEGSAAYYPDLEERIIEKCGYGSLDARDNLIAITEPLMSSKDAYWFEFDQSRFMSRLFHFGHTFDAPSRLVSRIGGMINCYKSDEAPMKMIARDPLTNEELHDEGVDSLRKDLEKGVFNFDISVFLLARDNDESEEERVIGPFGASKILVNAKRHFIRFEQINDDGEVQKDILGMWCPMIPDSIMNTAERRDFDHAEPGSPMSLASATSSLCSLAVLNALQRFEDEASIEALFSAGSG